ncbi:hypothetical protein JCM19235_6450 [Vibrio maritimus]|uniref:Uncharacterized protein n=1 Tax=Vibrio maritimus TaxID=990268 RepID=A0A090SEG3_9VIBR|nr:hypothetical protein JCM19235_6450 [Vibrio maritimus]
MLVSRSIKAMLIVRLNDEVIASAIVGARLTSVFSFDTVFSKK